MAKYHYEWFVYTDNMCHGRVKVFQSKDKRQALQVKQYCDNKWHPYEHYGCCVLERHRVTNR